MLGLKDTIWMALPLAMLAGLPMALAQDHQEDGAYELSHSDSAAFESVTAVCGCGDAVGCGAVCDAGAGGLGSTLRGDCHSHLQQSGITFAGKVTQFAFGVDGGINVPVPPPSGQGDTSKYTGRGEYDFLVDLEDFWRSF